MTRPGNGAPDEAADPLAPPDLGGPDGGGDPLAVDETDDWFARTDPSVEATGSGADGPLEAAARHDDELAYEETFGSAGALGTETTSHALDPGSGGGSVVPDVTVAPFGAEVPPLTSTSDWTPPVGSPDRWSEQSTSDSGSAVERLRGQGGTALATLRGLAERRPAVFLALAVLAGVLASRILGAGRDDEG